MRGRAGWNAWPVAVVLLGMAGSVSQPQAAPVTRERILATASSFAEHIWTCSLDNQFGGTVCHPDWLCDYQADTTYVGLPYDWGGYVTLDEFEQDLLDGKGAGSHSEWGVLACTTGLDCSGYVSQAWEVSHHTTSTLEAVAHVIDPAAVLPGDAYNKPGKHVVLWVRQAENGAPVFYEAAGRPVNKVQLTETQGWSYLEGYTAIRLDALEPPGPLTEGTLQHPIEVEAFPFESNHNTDLSTSRLWDRYACAPETDESGPEIFYRFTVSGPGTLTASVEDPTGVDVDLHLLSAPDPEACLARDDTGFSLALEAGTYWLVADTWVTSAGVELPGSYHLELTFERAAPPDGAAEVDAGVGPDGGPDAPGSDGPGPSPGEDGVGPTPGAEGEGGGSAGCLWVPNASVGAGEALLVFVLLLGLGLVLRLLRRRSP